MQYARQGSFEPRSTSSSTNVGPSARRSSRVRSGSASHLRLPIIRRMNRSAASSGVPCTASIPRPPAVDPGHHSSHDNGVSYTATARTSAGCRSAVASATLPPKLCPTSSARRPASSVTRSSTCASTVNGPGCGFDRPYPRRS